MMISRGNKCQWLCAWFLLATVGPAQAEDVSSYRRLSVREYRDKMKAGWIGQIAGVSWGASTEGRYQGRIIPVAEMPQWLPRMINDAFNQDDLYVEMTFLRSMEEYGLSVSIRQAGIDFANSGYPLWCANNAGRTNLRRGIAPPDSSHPRFNRCPNDIDYQIEADYAGLIGPGLPTVAIDMGEKFGRLMNYGDGMYAGQFISAMYAEAFFTEDIERIVETGLRTIPAECQYAEMVRDLLRWHREEPTNWEQTWDKIEKKYGQDPAYQQASNGPGIDCKSNGAFVLLGLLYGNRDLDQTVIISCRAGRDSDCNPSSSAGVLFTTVGFSKLPERFTRELDESRIFSHTAYNFGGLLDVCEKLARQAVIQEGGRMEKDAQGEEVFVIPVKAPKPSKLELSWAPGPITESRFTEAEMAQITVVDSLKQALQKFAPDWSITDCGTDMDPGLRDSELGRKNVLVTHPLDRQTPCVLSRKLAIPAGKPTQLKLVVGHHPQGDWDLIVKADGRELLRKSISSATAPDGWLEARVDLSPFAGQSIRLELCNQPTDWAWEAGYWQEISCETGP